SPSARSALRSLIPLSPFILPYQDYQQNYPSAARCRRRPSASSRHGDRLTSPEEARRQASALALTSDPVSDRTPFAHQHCHPSCGIPPHPPNSTGATLSSTREDTLPKGKISRTSHWPDRCITGVARGGPNVPCTRVRGPSAPELGVAAQHVVHARASRSRDIGTRSWSAVCGHRVL